MPTVKVNDITLNYEQQGSGEPLILIPFLTAENACYSFQVKDYAQHFTCISIDLRGTGLSDKPSGPYTTEDMADDIAGLMKELGIESAHVSGLSLGAGIGLCLAAKYPEKIKTLSVHAGWTKTDLFLKTVISSWQVSAKALGNIPELAIQNIFPWCFTPDLYSEKPEYIEALSDFVRSRPAQTVDDFLLHTRAVLNHNVEAQIDRITAPTQITLGEYDMITSTRFVAPMTDRIPNSELIIFENCAHAPLFEKVEEFNERTLEFLRRGQTRSLAAS